MSVCVSLCIYVCGVSVYCQCAATCICVSVCVYVFRYMCKFMCVHFCVCMYVYICVYMCEYVCGYMSVFLTAYVCAYMYAFMCTYRIAGYFRRVFIFGYFEEAFFYENKFPDPTVIRCLFALTWLHYLCSTNVFCSFIDILRGCQIQKAQNPKRCPQLLIRPLKKLCTMAARHFKTTEGVITILANICSGKQGNSEISL